MKVLHVIDALGVGGGAEHSLATMLPLLQERGVESSVVTLLPREGGLGEQLRQQGFQVEVLASQSLSGRARELRRRLREDRPDFVHATLYKASLAARIATYRSGVPLLNSLVNTSYDPVRLHMAGIVPWKLKIARTLDGFTARHAVDHVHAITSAVRDEATEVLGIAEERVTVIPRGRSRDLLGEPTPERWKRARAALGVSPEEFVILNVGRQDNQKAQADLIRAFAQVHRAHPHTTLLIAGREGNASHDVQSAVAETEPGGSVRLLGHRTDVLDLYVAADLFAFPSRYEGLGCSLIEAMALGTPIVGSDAPAIAEVLDNGSLGSVVQRGDIEALSGAMCRLIEHPADRDRFSERGRVSFSEHYELDRVADRTLAMYESVLARTSQADE